MVATQEGHTYLMSSRLQMSLGSRDVEPRATLCHMNHIHINGVCRNGRKEHHFRFPHIKDVGCLFITGEKKGVSLLVSWL